MEARARFPRSGARAAWLAVIASAALAGCFADPTEVVVVVDTDALPGTDYQQMQLTFTSSLGQGLFQETAFSNGSQLPVSVGATLSGSSTAFDVVVNLDGGAFGPVTNVGLPFSTRKVSSVSFVTDQMRMLFIPMFKKCACVDAAGMPTTSCPHALEPDCHDLVSPPLTAFDADHLPRLPASTSP
jgi:hypothetical protein